MARGIFKVDPRVALYIQEEILVLVLTLTRMLDEVDAHRAPIERSLDLFYGQLSSRAAGWLPCSLHRTASGGGGFPEDLSAQ